MGEQTHLTSNRQEETTDATARMEMINHWLTTQMVQTSLPTQTPEFIAWLTAIQALARYLHTSDQAPDETYQQVVTHLTHLFPPPPPEPLRIAVNCGLPEDTVSRTIGIFAMRGAGKSYSASVLVEELVKAGLMVILIDPLGVLWGLRSSADGEQPGLPILIFGGKHGDLPLLPTSGQHVCQALIDIRQPAILDLSQFSSEQAQQRFVADLIEGFRPHEELILHLVIDEGDIFAPQIPRSEAAQRSFEAMDTLIRRYRYKGLGATVITQRPAALHKNITDNLDALLVLRILSPRDTKAFQTWFERYATPVQRTMFLETLPQLANGSAWLWSPEWLKTFRQIQIRRRDTFDSSATPKAGVKRQLPRQLAEIDLAGLQDRLAQLQEPTNDSDPAYLCTRIADLEAQLALVRATGQNGQSRGRASLGTTEKGLRDQLHQLQQALTQAHLQMKQKDDRIAALETQLELSSKSASSHEPNLPSPIQINELRPQVGRATIEVQNLQVSHATPPLIQEAPITSLPSAEVSESSIESVAKGTFLQSEQALLEQVEHRVHRLSPLEKRLLLWLLEHDGQKVTVRQLAEAVGIRTNALYEQPPAQLEKLPFIEKSRSTPTRYSSTLAAYCERNLSSCPDYTQIQWRLLQAAGAGK